MVSNSLPPTDEDLVWPKPEDYGSMSRTMAGWSVFGLAVRAMQLGLHQRPLRSAPHIYAYGGIIWGAIGYGLYKYERRIKYRLAQKKQQILEYRAMERQSLNQLLDKE